MAPVSTDTGAAFGGATATGVAVVKFTAVSLMGAILGLLEATLIVGIGAVVRFDDGAIGFEVSVTLSSMVELQ